MPPRTSLPTYLTSGASSRAHHGLLVKLNEANSVQEEDVIINEEIRKAKAVLEIKAQATSKIAETLIVLLHCSILRHTTTTPTKKNSALVDDDGDLDFALVSAIQLAEGGRTLADRRIGYLYLVERMSKEHELNLLLINTIRKDLSSTTPSYILLALHTIVKLPSSDLAPAVTPILTSKQLLRHKLPSIRQRTIQALSALHSQDRQPFPISVAKLTKTITLEDDRSVLSALLKLVRLMIEGNNQSIDNEEKEDLIQATLEAARQSHVGPDGQILLDITRAMAVLIVPDPTNHVAQQAADWLIEQLETTNVPRRRQAAFLLELSRFVGTVQDDRLTAITLQRIAQLLRPDHSGPSSSTAPPSLPSPNEHVLALRCLDILPMDIWDGHLSEDDMSVIMEGVNSADDTIRRQTIGLLSRMSPDLPDMILQRYIDALNTSSDLSLPLNVPNVSITIEEKTRLARLETASRAMEVIEVVNLVDVNRRKASEYVRSLIKVLEALEKDQAEKSVWEGGVRRVLDQLQNSPTTFRQDFVISLCDALSSDVPTPAGNSVLVILTVAACEHPLPTNEGKKLVRYLSSALITALPSVQELVLAILVSLLARTAPSVRAVQLESVVAAVQQLESQASRYIKKRCTQVLAIIQRDLFDEVVSSAKSLALPDILNAISQIHARHLAVSSQNTPEVVSLPTTQARSLNASQLRYDAYDSPKFIFNRYRDAKDGQDEDTDDEDD